MKRIIFTSVALALCVTAEAATVAVNVDTSQDRRSIDPRIYGVNFGTAGQLVDPGFTVRRWGGNSTTRYNYTTDVSNRGFDYVFLNVFEGGTGAPNQSSLNTFIDETLAAGRTPLVTIGTIGWRPIDNAIAKRYGFAIPKYGPQLRNGCPWDCNGGNGRCDSAVNTTGYCPDIPNVYPDLIVNNQPTDTSVLSDSAFAKGWVQHLAQRHAQAVDFYALDNEPMLWNSTHRDVHPTPATYDEIWNKTVDYGKAIKSADAGAKLFGPVTWGYCDLFSSAADGCHVGADRNAHGGLPFVQWYLRQVCAYQQQHGVRLIDYLDLHYYPQGQITPEIGVVDFGDGANDEMTAGLRLRSLKELYDPNWVAESWFADLGDSDANHYSKPQIIRRVKAWIAAECPSVKLAITEYQWGSDHGASSALAHAEVLAIFGREGVDFATRWVAPEPGSRVERAFRLFLDYDGNGSRVEGDSVRAVSANVDALGAYAVDLPNQRTMLLLFNKSTVANTAQIALNGARNGAWKLYRFDADHDVAQVASGNIAGNTLTLADLPARSANLLVLPAGGSAPGSRIFADGFE
jgi:hypothetical protein